MNVRAFRGQRCDFKHLVVVIVVWSTACCALVLAGCGTIPNPEASDGTPESFVIRVDSRPLCQVNQIHSEISANCQRLFYAISMA